MLLICTLRKDEYVNMNSKYIKTLEYDKVIHKLSTYCKTYIGKENAANLLPSFEKNSVASLLEITKEAISLVYRKGSIPLSDIPNITLPIKNLESSGILSAFSLLNIARFFKISREVKEYFFASEVSNNNINLDEYHKLYDLFDLLYTNKNIEEKIFSIILDENTIADDASPKLNALRKQSKKLEQDVRDKLNSFIHSSTYSKYIMEPIVTIRSDRYVVPIKEEYRSQVKGFIHDVSSSGSTVFVEPISVFELNNEIANLKVEEEIEIEQILSDLSAMLYDHVDVLKNNISIFGDLDLAFAKACYSIELDGILPQINEDKYINLISARHPLIDKNAVVPIDIAIGKDYSTLVITGPNTGGKTVSLKTTGLLLLMAYSGIFIPAKEGSLIYVFDDIFADIGDEQSIQENLSTFSSHITNIVEITQNVTSHSLVLLDELGSGTDPIEGANLAISTLKYFFDLGATTMCTTHYQELKNYCLVTEGFQNASCEFDVEHLKPTYKLLIGIPGKSNAFAISKKLGLDSKILDMANSLMKNNDISIEELMKNIYDNKIAIEKEKEKIEKNSAQIEMLRTSLEKENANQKEKQNKIIEDAKKEARDIISSAKEKANAVIKELNNMDKSDLAKANNLRNTLNDELKEFSPNTSDSGLNLDVLRELNNKFSLKNSSLGLENKKGKNNHNNSSNNSKTSSSSDSNLKSTYSVSFIKGEKFKSQTISSEINVIGMNVEEATFEIDKYLDDCAISKLSTVRIVHGKGTGKLREGIHQFLKKNPHVKSFRLGTFGEGEMGVTIVELK